MKRFISTAVLLGIAVSFALAQQGDTEAEIKRARKEFMQLQTEREKNKLDRAKDQKDFEEYMKRTAERLAAVKSETDTINRQIAVQRRRNDSLAALINSANAQASQFEKSQEVMRERLIGSCDGIIANLKGTPPMVRQNLVASTALLKNELRNKSVDNVEALNRLQQIADRTEEINGSIQVSQESSPVAEIRGTVYRLRVGAFFEAVVNVKGDECAVWHAADTAGWKKVSDPAVAAEILKAATIREGKTMPAFVKIPLVAGAEKGGKQ